MDLGEAKRWISQHGSRRMKLCVEQGFLERSLSLYIDERLNLELPNWSRHALRNDVRLEAPINPFEDDLVALKTARRQIPEANLYFDRDARTCYILAGFHGKIIRFTPPTRRV